MHRRPPTERKENITILLPPEIHQMLAARAVKEGVSVNDLTARAFLLLFLSFDIDLFILEDGVYKKVLYKEGS